MTSQSSNIGRLFYSTFHSGEIFGRNRPQKIPFYVGIVRFKITLVALLITVLRVVFAPHPNDSYYGPDRHQMAKMWEEGIRVRDEDGVWMEDHNDTCQLNGTTKQTFIQRERESMPRSLARLLRGGGWYMVPILITSLLCLCLGMFTGILNYFWIQYVIGLVLTFT